jgi:ABC-type branched-subunit amino acid transport system substrate-binding protein
MHIRRTTLITFFKSAVAMLASAILSSSALGMAIAADAPETVIGVTPSEVLIGSELALTGQMKDHGKSMKEGAALYFSYINEKGGIHGRKVRFEAYDHEYDPDKAIECFNNYLKDKAFAGAIFEGSSCIAKIVRLGDTTQMPLVGFLVGTSAVYQPHPTQFTLRPSYKDEVNAQVDELLKHNVKRIAIIYQADAFGSACEQALNEALNQRGLSPVANVSYSRNSGDISEPMRAIKAANPQALVMASANIANEKILRMTSDEHWKTIRLTFSPNDYVAGLGPISEQAVVSQVIPPLDESLPTVALYHKLYRKAHPGTPMSDNAENMEAFLNAMIVCEALNRAGPNLTRVGFVKALESMDGFDLGMGPKFKTHFSSKNHIGWSPKAIYLSIVDHGKLRPMRDADWSALAPGG